MNWIDRFCYKHPRFGIPNLMKVIVIGTVIVYVMYLFSGMNPMFFSLLSFNAHAFLHGEIWRIVTFLFVPTNTSIFFLAISLYFYYLIGRTLEQQWGTAKFNVFYFTGAVLAVVAALVVYAATGRSVLLYGAYYVNLSMFFAFATLHPNFTVLLFFFIPVKMKWLAILDAVLFAVEIIRSLGGNFPVLALVPVFALLNYFLFFHRDIFALVGLGRTRKGPKVVDFKKAAKPARKQQDQAREQGYRHKCAVCGRTDTECPDLEFRYCSRCNGYYCYCQDHINNHVHIQ